MITGQLTGPVFGTGELDVLLKVGPVELQSCRSISVNYVNLVM
jgi:hypothetical protein